jgi:predicted ABC-type sugar transport system permease subunit
MNSLVLRRYLDKNSFRVVRHSCLNTDVWFRTYVSFVPLCLIALVVFYIQGWEAPLTTAGLLAVEGALMSMIVLSATKRCRRIGHGRNFVCAVAAWIAGVWTLQAEFQIDGLPLDMLLGMGAGIRLFMLVPGVIWPMRSPQRQDENKHS